MDLFLFYIPFKGDERPAKTKLLPAKLSENKYVRENILTCLLGTKMGLIHEIQKMPKHLVKLPL